MSAAHDLATETAARLFADFPDVEAVRFGGLRAPKVQVDPSAGAGRDAQAQIEFHARLYALHNHLRVALGGAHQLPDLSVSRDGLLVHGRAAR